MLFTRRPGAVRLALATLVVLHHTTTLRLGKFAVYSFFVLSGFWVFRIYRDRYARSTHAIARFYASRWLRIFPLYLVCSLLALLLFHRNELSATFVARTLSVPVHELVGTNVLPPVWSLDVELQFYLVVPLLLLVSQTRAFRDLPSSLRIALGSATVLGLWLVKATALKFGLFFAIGIYLSESPRRFSPVAVWTSFALTILIGTSAFVFGSPGFHDTYPVEVAMTVTFIPVIAESLREAGSVRDRRIGELSYPLYLFHWIPAFYLRQQIGFYAGHDFTLRDVSAVACAWLASFAGAYLLWRMIDIPMERLRRAWLEPATRPVLHAQLQPQLDRAAQGE